jgi:hypothetical protein
MSMALMELKRELENRNIDRNVQYFIAALYEHQIALEQQFDEAAKVMLSMARSLEALVEANGSLQEKILKFVNRGSMPGVDVRSVLNDPEDS